MATTSSRASPPSLPAARPEMAWRRSCEPTVEASLTRIGAAEDPRRSTNPIGPPAIPSARPRAMACGFASSDRTPRGAWVPSSSPSTANCTAKWPSSRSSTSTPTTRSAAGDFVLEAEITGGLEHPGIVPVYGLGAYSDGRPYYAMRFIRGESLKEAIDRFHERTNTKLPSPLARRTAVAGRGPRPRPPVELELRKLLRRFTDVCNAIEYAHSRGVLHRDIKPSNIIVGRHGETLVVDWGLAKATGKSDPSAAERTLMPSPASGSSETLPGSALGTPAFMSPEQAEGHLDRLGPQSDVYSLGATLYCLLTWPAALRGRGGRRPSRRATGRVPRAAPARPQHRPGARGDLLESHGLPARGPVPHLPGADRRPGSLDGRRARHRVARAPGAGRSAGRGAIARRSLPARSRFWPAWPGWSLLPACRPRPTAACGPPTSR